MPIGDKSKSDGDRAALATKVVRLVRIADVITLVLGLWLIGAPYALDYAEASGVEGFWNDGVVGAVLTFAGLIRLVAPLGALAARLASLLLGVWLTLAPAVLGYVGGSAPMATVSEVTVGVVIAVLALVTVLAAAAVSGADGATMADGQSTS